ncbi:ABC transporter permease [Desulfogranum marinum]|uniref:ABC transporter permease n=1 Tax=Desulfogranum marinum TaxID=453220 RepID=UPI0019647BB3|nr:FtsX-like permease family protein [Desulfogranum marinum]MBM9512079.1 ABC transporter permease [Desulfogranum marinum]
MYIILAWRNLWRNRRRTLIILTAVIIGISSMIVMAAFSRGTVQGMVSNSINNLVGHIKIEHQQHPADPAIEHRIITPEKLLRQITAMLPPGSRVVQRIRADAMLSTSREHVGLVLVGIDPDLEQGVSFIGRPPAQGTLFGNQNQGGIIVGRSLLKKINGKLGQKVVITCQGADGTNIAKAFRIQGVFATELESTERAFAFVQLHTMQQMLGVGNDITEIAIQLPDNNGNPPVDLAATTAFLQANVSDKQLLARNWRQMLPAISSYLEMFDGFMLIWYLIVFLAMAFGLVNTMLMAVYERMREFGLLQALGMRPGCIIKMVMSELLLLLTFGCSISSVAAFITVHFFFSSGIDLAIFAEGAEFWGISRIIYPLLTSWDIIAANSVVLLLGMFTGLYPALRATKFSPVQTMRHV